MSPFPVMATLHARSFRVCVCCNRWESSSSASHLLTLESSSRSAQRVSYVSKYLCVRLSCMVIVVLGSHEDFRVFESRARGSECFNAIARARRVAAPILCGEVPRDRNNGGTVWARSCAPCPMRPPVSTMLRADYPQYDSCCIWKAQAWVHLPHVPVCQGW